jgi:hypothetical protein
MNTDDTTPMLNDYIAYRLSGVGVREAARMAGYSGPPSAYVRRMADLALQFAQEAGDDRDKAIASIERRIDELRPLLAGLKTAKRAYDILEEIDEMKAHAEEGIDDRRARHRAAYLGAFARGLRGEEGSE